MYSNDRHPTRAERNLMDWGVIGVDDSIRRITCLVRWLILSSSGQQVLYFPRFRCWPNFRCRSFMTKHFLCFEPKATLYREPLSALLMSSSLFDSSLGSPILRFERFSWCYWAYPIPSHRSLILPSRVGFFEWFSLWAVDLLSWALDDLFMFSSLIVPGPQVYYLEAQAPSSVFHVLSFFCSEPLVSSVLHDLRLFYFKLLNADGLDRKFW